MVLSGLLAASGVGLHLWLSHREEERWRLSWRFTSALVAAEDLPAGTVLEAKHVAPRALPGRLVTAQVITAPAELVGLTLTVPLRRGTPFHRGAFAVCP